MKITNTTNFKFILLWISLFTTLPLSAQYANVKLEELCKHTTNCDQIIKRIYTIDEGIQSLSKPPSTEWTTTNKNLGGFSNNFLNIHAASSIDYKFGLSIIESNISERNSITVTFYGKANCMPPFQLMNQIKTMIGGDCLLKFRINRNEILTGRILSTRLMDGTYFFRIHSIENFTINQSISTLKTAENIEIEISDGVVYITSQFKPKSRDENKSQTNSEIKSYSAAKNSSEPETPRIAEIITNEIITAANCVIQNNPALINKIKAEPFEGNSMPQANSHLRNVLNKYSDQITDASIICIKKRRDFIPKFKSEEKAMRISKNTLMGINLVISDHMLSGNINAQYARKSISNKMTEEFGEFYTTHFIENDNIAQLMICGYYLEINNISKLKSKDIFARLLHIANVDEEEKKRILNSNLLNLLRQDSQTFYKESIGGTSNYSSKLQQCIDTGKILEAIDPK